MDEIKPDLLVSEFLDCLRERADKSFKGHLHQAFIDWYVEAEFGQSKWAFTDGPNDGGIDAVVWRKPEDKPSVIIIQSKFSQKIDAQKLHRSAYRDFERVVKAFYHRDEAFEEFLDGVAQGIRKTYLKAFRLLNGNWLSEKKAFRLITTLQPVSRFEFDHIPRDNFVYGTDVLNLYRQFRRVWAPKARELTLSVPDKLSYGDGKRGVTSYLFNARVSDFKKYLEHNDVARLVARNIRYDLRGQVGREIRKTYESAPQDFWYLHNGITIVCDDFEERNRRATLTNPSVINGAQTLYAVDRSCVENSPAMVGTRVIVRGIESEKSTDDDVWLQKIIRGVNTQNRVHNYDFRSNEPEQVLLQGKFRDLGVFYERKRGEWAEFRTDPRYKGFRKLSLPLLGQILTVVSDYDGEGVIIAKGGLDKVFDDRHYDKIFPPRPKIAYRFRDVYIAYRLFEMLSRMGYANAKDYSRQRHAFWNSLWLLHRGVMANGGRHLGGEISRVKHAFDVVERRRRTGRVVRSLTRAVWRAWRIDRKRDPERYTPNNFFKSRHGNRRTLSIAFPRVRKDLRSLGRDLSNAS